ncbi:aprataxin-like [Oppia nitens]|uniref:aprataxin-like n=1 Tax=Oppia nitens TaxID=1686743 RepID=UPI0023DA98EB|nr:aprataxin-like [Oppia nitens]XP_054168422.1 aprataxin-like [Oppia nitens]
MKRSTQTHDKPLMVKKSTKMSNSWTNCLFHAIKDPNLIVLKDQLITIIKDKYPKSRHHFMVIPNEDIGINSIEDLSKCHVQLIDYMTDKGNQLSHKLNTNIAFRFGFHRIPSLKPLHLHVISQDFDSKYLKTKKHYNSFTTNFFIDSKTVIDNLNQFDKVEALTDEECNHLLKQEIVCHFCRLKIANIPQLKTHLVKHFLKS